MSEQNINEEEFRNKIKELRNSYSELGNREAKVSGNLSSIWKRIREKASLKNSIEKELSTLRKCYEQMKTNELQSIHAHKTVIGNDLNDVWKEYKEIGGMFCINELIDINGSIVKIVYKQIDSGNLKIYYCMRELYSNSSFLQRVEDDSPELKMVGKFAIGDMLEYNGVIVKVVDKNLQRSVKEYSYLGPDRYDYFLTYIVEFQENGRNYTKGTRIPVPEHLLNSHNPNKFRVRIHTYTGDNINFSVSSLDSTSLYGTTGLITQKVDNAILFKVDSFFIKKAIEDGGYYLDDKLILIEPITSNVETVVEHSGKFYNVYEQK